MKTTRITCKLCRREGVSLCGREKCAVKRRPYPPGVHGPKGGSRQTDYAKQLREKQKAKRLYGLSERQFENYFEKALRMKGDSGENLMRLLEMRLDNAVFRAGFAKSRPAARQTVSHAHISVNGKKVDIASFTVKPGDVLQIRETKRAKNLWQGISEKLQQKEPPSWISVTPVTLEAKITSAPAMQDMLQPFDAKLIIEFYSR